MQKRIGTYLFLTLAGFVFIIVSLALYRASPPQLATISDVKSPVISTQLAAVIKEEVKGEDVQVLHLGTHTKKFGCEVRGPLPDPDCSPGAVFAAATPADICTPGYSAKVRSVSAKLKKQVYAEYGITYPQPTGSYEADHLIPLELGGNNDIANLFPEVAAPAPLGHSTATGEAGFHEKDLVENYLHAKMCAGAVSLVAAQEIIARNWLEVYNNLTPEEIVALKRQKASFGD